MTATQVATSSRERRQVGPGDSSSARRLVSARVRPLSEGELEKITSFNSEKEITLATLERMKLENTELRKRIAELQHAEPQGFFGRCAAWVASKFGSKDALSSSREQLEKQLAHNVKKTRLFSEKFVQPHVDAIRRRYVGKTFERTKDTPRLLTLASVPSEKVGKIPSHATLFDTVTSQVESGKLPGIKIIQRDKDNSITIIRRNQYQEEETVRLSYRREGKVDAEIIGAMGTQTGSFWNDDALKLVQAFNTGRNFSLKPAKFKNYTVV